MTDLIVNRRTVLAASAAAGAATLLSQTAASAAEEVLSSGRADTSSIRQFHVHFSDESLANLKRRILETNWPEAENDPTQGVHLATIQKLADHWANHHDWRRAEAQINGYPNFITSIDGVDIHFIQVKSKHPNALPVIVTHGWPGSVIEQLKIIGPLTDPTAHGGSAADAFDVVIPSLPGYGFSGKPTVNGWDPQRIARAWAVLMQRLGYDRYVAQGGDWGNAVTEQMALQQPPGLLAIHTNMPATVPAEIAPLIPGGPEPAGLNSEEKHAWDQLVDFYSNGLGYAQEMAGRPQTLYALADSPIGLAAWIIDHDIQSYNLISRVFDGADEGLTKDDIVDNIALYWLTNTAVSSARLYRESKLPFFAPKGVPLPTGVSAFREEIYQAPESWTRKAYPNLVFYRRHDKGTHFAAWEQPQALSQDLRDTFRSVR
ncbi:epoxide hydrolase family protein [Altererythrobacter sp. Root672]|uniref:epoxide hydrolase family protein n=1 Tax=Altererythrobacter sp. Root672 TaxID=1736584 RepID=UPI0006FC0783|nr:epoxide hydrolase family protein [Altererythrobacter sp. Root672]KRA83357.1 multidrug MFS transporter [Altererythrobacter sp. Root672]